MWLQRSIRKLARNIHRLSLLCFGDIRFWWLTIIAAILYFMVVVSIKERAMSRRLRRNVSLHNLRYQVMQPYREFGDIPEKSMENVIEKQIETIPDKRMESGPEANIENITRTTVLENATTKIADFIPETNKNSFVSLNLNESVTTVEQAKRKPTPSEIRSLYEFIDIDELHVDLAYLDQEQRPPENYSIETSSLSNHVYSQILDVKGDASIIMYNRLPQCYENTMNSLLNDIANLNLFHYLSSKIYVPFLYNRSALISIARSLHKQPFKHLIYERHIYFFDFQSLQFSSNPVWINLVNDPITRVAAEYERSREICRAVNRCFVQPETMNETLDECVLKRPPHECISPRNGVSRMLPFFCGAKYPYRCQLENDWALQQAKYNIDFYFTVVGFAEDFYKFLYVLEKLLPQYFKFARLLFMNQRDPKKLADERDVNITNPSNRTKQILRPLLKYEYALYDFIIHRFFEQYRILVELDN